jgi:hypothetical protein
MNPPDGRQHRKARQVTQGTGGHHRSPLREPWRDGTTQGRRVLGTGPLPVAALLARVHRPGVSLLVARASLSRTLRRLWAAELVELAIELAAVLPDDPEVFTQLPLARRSRTVGRVEGSSEKKRTSTKRTSTMRKRNIQLMMPDGKPRTDLVVKECRARPS